MRWDIDWPVFQLYKSAIGNIFEEEEWGPLEYSIMAKHFERQGKTPYSYHSVSLTASFLLYCMFLELKHLYSLFAYLFFGNACN